MSSAVLDASAILAVIGSEAGSEQVLQLPHAVVSAVNLAEVQSKLVVRGYTEELAWKAASGVCREVFTFDAEQARIAGSLISATKSLGLSLGDRACLALGLVLRLPVYTSDRIWTKLELGIEIQILR